MARRGGAAFIWTWGVICGVVLGVIQIIISLLPFGSLKTILDLLVWLIGFFVIVQIATNGQELTQVLNQAAQSAQHQGRSLSSSALYTVAVVGVPA